jgi:uncharacterized protein (TIGR00251 family)
VADRPWRRTPDGLVLHVRLTPKAASDSIDGIAELSDGRAVLSARVRALPDKGAANAALEALVAKALNVAKRDVAIVAGATARLKTLKIAGDSNALEETCERLATARQSRPEKI